ncbi:dihydropteroate synthase [Sulfurimonas aquatica]|uniref:dihydropteroate synthase n=1 Tax=Sulfurimonas aquatica TaxID=2672570 RepID=A0A975B1H4_9BACT|nr:dihydropteroate synthase [Sulfurimonas aquatica]QSZ42496.1 dihydropteroate synthase [Sulfurimonas aquatica]
MIVKKLSNAIDVKKHLQELGVDGGGVQILTDKAKTHIIYIEDLNVGAANILKQDALSIGADLAVPRGTVLATTPKVNAILIATTAQLKTLAKKELSQPFGLKGLAAILKEYSKIKKPSEVEVMGVINANDDSFFSESRFEKDEAIIQIQKMMEDGATIIDIGGVSSRPNSTPVSADEELSRVKPIIDVINEKELHQQVKFSIDSYEPSVIEYALKSGFSIVNDITGLIDDEVCKVCAKYNATVVIMHMQGNPQTMQDNPQYDNILTDIYSFFEDRIEKADSFGIKNIILDVGIGFGKSLEDNLLLIKHLENFSLLGKKLLVGASRKSMIDAISSSLIKDRLPGTLAIHLESVRNGASILRVHDVAEHIQALRLQSALDEITLKA